MVDGQARRGPLEAVQHLLDAREVRVLLEQALRLERVGDLGDQVPPHAADVRERREHPDRRGAEGDDAERFDGVAGGTADQEVVGQHGRRPCRRPRRRRPVRSGTAAWRRRGSDTAGRGGSLAGTATSPTSRATPAPSPSTERTRRSGRESRYAFTFNGRREPVDVSSFVVASRSAFAFAEQRTATNANANENVERQPAASNYTGAVARSSAGRSHAASIAAAS